MNTPNVWLPPGFDFLCGLPERQRRMSILMPITVFVDESGWKGQGGTLVLSGLGASAENWAAFSDEWQQTLSESPSINILKMRHAAALQGDFYCWSSTERDAKLKALAKIINKYVDFSLYSAVDLQDFESTFAALTKPMNDPYYWGFQNMISGLAVDLWEVGLREPFEIIFDEQKRSGLLARKYYPLHRAVFRLSAPDEGEILPTDVVFRSDDTFPPLQASDLFAWCLRKNTDQPGGFDFGWLEGELKNIRASKNSMHMDYYLMQGMQQEALVKKVSALPRELLEVYDLSFKDAKDKSS